MGIIGLVIWGLLLIGVLQLAVPSAEMKKEQTGIPGYYYYLIWGILIVLLLSGQYQIMASWHEGRLGLATDAVAIGVFLLGHLLLSILRWRYHSPCPQVEAPPHDFPPYQSYDQLLPIQRRRS